MELKKHRTLLNKTQAEVSKDLNMPRTKYARYELETAEPNIKTLIQLADYFHTTVDHLIGHEVPYLINKSTLTDNQLELFEMIQKLSDTNCNLVKAYLVGLLTAEEEKQNIIKKFKGE